MEVKVQLQGTNRGSNPARIADIRDYNFVGPSPGYYQRPNPIISNFYQHPNNFTLPKLSPPGQNLAATASLNHFCPPCNCSECTFDPVICTAINANCEAICAMQTECTFFQMQMGRKQGANVRVACTEWKLDEKIQGGQVWTLVMLRESDFAEAGRRE